MPLEVMSLPLAVQVAALGGILAFLLGNYGRLDQYPPAAMTLHIGVWSLVVATIFWIVDQWADGTLVVGLTTLAAVVLAIVWRKWLSRFLSASARRWGFSFVNNEPSALATLQNDCDHAVSQIAVLTDDGEWLRCEDTGLFRNAPFGPCQIGPKGDVAMYITQTKDASGAVRHQVSTINEEYGYRITYIPADRIRRMNLRYMPRR